MLMTDTARSYLRRWFLKMKGREPTAEEEANHLAELQASMDLNAKMNARWPTEEAWNKDFAIADRLLRAAFSSRWGNDAPLFEEEATEAMESAAESGRSIEEETRQIITEYWEVQERDPDMAVQ